MKVLWVSPQQPGPSGGGGSNHEFELLRAMSARHEIEVISSYDAADLDGLEVPLEIVPFTTRGAPQTRLATMLALAQARQPLHSWVLRERIPAMRDAIRRHGRVDLVHVMMGEIAPVLDAVEGPSSLLLFDSYARHAEALLRIESGHRRRVRWKVERGLARSFERRWYQRPTALACVSSDDSAALGALLGRSVEVLPNPIADDFFAPSARERSLTTVLFVGSMGYAPNAEALEWFHTEIWPAVVEQRPDMRFVAAGRGSDAPERVRYLRRFLGDSLVLDVPDIRPLYWEAAVCVAPVRLGAGLRNKVIHAMACGAPVVSTSAAAEGTGAIDGEHLLVADDAQAFAEAIIDVVSNRSAALVRAERARALVRGLHIDHVAELMERWWEGAVDDAGVLR